MPLQNQTKPNQTRYLERAADFTARALAMGGGVYIHCIAGMSRSVTIALAYLVKHGGFTLRGAYERCRARRYIIDPNKTFLCEIVRALATRYSLLFFSHMLLLTYSSLTPLLSSSTC